MTLSICWFGTPDRENSKRATISEFMLRRYSFDASATRSLSSAGKRRTNLYDGSATVLPPTTTTTLDYNQTASMGYQLDALAASAPAIGLISLTTAGREPTPSAAPVVAETGAESVDKPGSVVDSHSSRATVTDRLQRPTRVRRGPRPRTPIWPCSGRGLPSQGCCQSLRCALTAPFHPCRRHRLVAMRGGGLLSAALSVGSRPPGVTWRPVLWSPDFPHADEGARLPDRLGVQPTRSGAAWKPPVHRAADVADR